MPGQCNNVRRDDFKQLVSNNSCFTWCFLTCSLPAGPWQCRKLTPPMKHKPILHAVNVIKWLNVLFLPRKWCWRWGMGTVFWTARPSTTATLVSGRRWGEADATFQGQRSYRWWQIINIEIKYRSHIRLQSPDEFNSITISQVIKCHTDVWIIPVLDPSV